MEQYQKFPSDEIGSPRVDLQDAIASPTPMLPPVFARSMTPPTGNSPPLDTPLLPPTSCATPTAAPAADQPKVLASHMPSLNVVKNEEGESGG